MFWKKTLPKFWVALGIICNFSAPALPFSIMDNVIDDKPVGKCTSTRVILPSFPEGGYYRSAYVKIEGDDANGHSQLRYAGGSRFNNNTLHSGNSITKDYLAHCLGVSESNIIALSQNGADGTFIDDQYIGYSYTIGTDENGVSAGVYTHDYTANKYNVINASVNADVPAGVQREIAFTFHASGGHWDKVYWIAYVDQQSDCPGNRSSISPFSSKYVPINDESKNGKYICAEATDTFTSDYVVSSNKVLVDANAPTLAVNDVVRSTAPGLAVASIDLSTLASANDTVDASPRIDFKIDGNSVSGTQNFPVGTTSISARAIDHVNRKSASKTFTITVEDNEDPVLRLPSNITSNTDSGQATAIIDITTLGATATDNADPNVSISYHFGPTLIGGPFAFPVGRNTVNVQAEDASGNTAHGSFILEVLDVEQPTILKPSNILSDTDAGKSTAEVNVTNHAVVTDNVPSGIIVTYKLGSTILTGNYNFQLGTTTINVEAKDAANNSAIAQTFDVIISDNEMPQITPPPMQVYDAVPPAQTASLDVTTLGTIVSDNVGIATIVYRVGNIQLTGPYQFPIGDTIVTIDAVDLNGNTAAQAQFTVRVRDIDPPIIAPVGDLFLQVATGNNYVIHDVTSLGSVTDNHSSNLSIIYRVNGNIINGPYTFLLGSTTVTMDATDGSNNNALQQSFTVTVQDSVPPDMPEVPNVSFSTDDAIILEGKAERNAQIVVRFADGKLVKTVADDSGSYLVQSANNQQNGQITIQAIDAGDNRSAIRTLDVIVRGEPITVSFSDVPEVISGGASFILQVTFSETVSGFEASDFLSTNARFSIIGSNADATIYSVSVETSGTGTVAFYLPAGVVSGTQRNTNLSSKPVSLLDRTQSETVKVVTRHVFDRANQLLKHQPQISPFLRNKTAAASAKATFDGAKGSVSVNNLYNMPIWMQMSGSLTSSDNSKSLYLFNATGAHGYIHPNILLGGMLELDYIQREDGAARSQGVGWLIGPYFAAQFADQPLYLDGKILYGKTRNEILPFNTYSDWFDTTRFLAQVQLSGAWSQKNSTWEPFLDASYFSEFAQDYTDSLGNDVYGQNIELVQVKTGLNYEHSLSVQTGEFVIRGGLSGIWSATNSSLGATSVVPSYEGWRGSTKLGLSYKTDRDTQINFDAQYDGLSTKGYKSLSLGLSINQKF
ncbi:HYR domain-containing protein [Pseudovibrio sp. SCP19]|uniref:HYR domain-containing protein n=1 Tax=Pseudovibrio sp. SCP19 TaxID=3141374 RepID=UPI0033354EF0